MLTDELDQSFGLATLLKARYEGGAWEGGAGGRLEYRQMPGTHVTPNTPSLRGLDWGAADQLGLLDLVAQVRSPAISTRAARPRPRADPPRAACACLRAPEGS